MARGADLTIVGYFEWSHHRPLFKNFIETLYGKRLEAKRAKNGPLSETLKLVMNSLSGKLGQRTFDQSCILHNNDLVLFQGDSAAMADFAYRSEDLLEEMSNITNQTASLSAIAHLSGDYSQLFFQNDPLWDTHSPGAFVHLISYITAIGRSRLAKFQRIAGAGSYWYCDTDSIVVDDRGFQRLHGYIDPVQLGCLKEEHTLRFFHCLSPKFYVAQDINGTLIAHAKGVSLAPLTDPHDLIDFFLRASESRPDPRGQSQTQFRRRFGHVEINEIFKSTVIKRKLTDINPLSGAVRPPRNMYDYIQQGQSFQQIFSYV